MRVTKYILALMVGSLALLTSARLDLAVVRAEPDSVPAAAKPSERTRRAPGAKSKLKRPIQLDIKAIEAPPAITVTAPAAPPRENPVQIKKGPHVDMEGLLIGDTHIQPNIMFNTDTRYDNAATRERAQRDDLDFLAARQHGDSTRSPNPVDDLLRAKPPVTPGSPGSNDPGYEVAVAVRAQLDVLPPKPATPSAAAAAAAAPSQPTRRTAPKATAPKATAPKATAPKAPSPSGRLSSPGPSLASARGARIPA